MNMMMSKSLKHWMLRVARDQYWRIAAWHELDDLIQEGYLCFYKCVKTYPDACANPAHIGRLFQVSFINRIHTLATRKTCSINEISYDALAEQYECADDIIESMLGMAEAPQTEALTHAPWVVKEAIKLYANNDRRLRPRIYRRVRMKPDHTRETLNDRLCRLLGMDPRDVNVNHEIREYLAGT